MNYFPTSWILDGSKIAGELELWDSLNPFQHIHGNRQAGKIYFQFKVLLLTPDRSLYL
jgi:hypothetical protein